MNEDMFIRTSSMIFFQAPIGALVLRKGCSYIRCECAWCAIEEFHTTFTHKDNEGWEYNSCGWAYSEGWNGSFHACAHYPVIWAWDMAGDKDLIKALLDDAEKWVKTFSVKDAVVEAFQAKYLVRSE